MKPKGDIEIGYRAYEEAIRIFGAPYKAYQTKAFSKNTLYAWRDGITPGGLQLAKLHYAGADVIYILTGKRSGSIKDGAECAPKKM